MIEYLADSPVVAYVRDSPFVNKRRQVLLRRLNPMSIDAHTFAIPPDKFRRQRQRESPRL